MLSEIAGATKESGATVIVVQLLLYFSGTIKPASAAGFVLVDTGKALARHRDGGSTTAIVGNAQLSAEAHVVFAVAIIFELRRSGVLQGT